MKKAFAISMILVLLCAAGALAEEGVRVAGSKLPYVIGGAAAIAIGVLITVAMVASKEGRALVVTPTGLPIPVPLFPVLIGLAIGLTLINTTPKDSYTLNGVRYTLGEKTASANGPAKGAEVPEVLKLPAEVEGLPLTGVGGFDGSAGLREVVLPLSVTNLGPGVFKDCANLETVRFEGGTAPDDDMRWLWLSIGDEAFSGCEALKNLLFPNTQSIGERAFMGCAALTRVELPGVYAGVGKQAFSGCKALESVTLSGDIQRIGEEAFAGCGALKALRLQGGEADPHKDYQMFPSRADDNKLVVGARAFQDCGALVTVEFPAGDTTKSIGERAFAGCATLDIEVPAAHLEKYCFEGCASLRSAATNHGWAIDNDRRDVPEGAFKDCSGLLVVDLNGISTVGDSAFEGCTSLKQVTATWTEKVGKRAFADCPALQVVGFGEGTLKSLSVDAFEGSGGAVVCDDGDAKVRKLAEAAGVKGDGGLWFECDYLPDGTLRLTNWHMTSEDVTGTFTVPGEWVGLPVSTVGLVRNYSYTGSEFPLRHEEIVVGDGITTLEEKCFENWEPTLKRIHLPDSIQNIERDAIRSDSDDMTIYTTSAAAIQYAERWGWTVAEP